MGGRKNNGYMNEWMDGWMDGWMDKQKNAVSVDVVHEQTDGWMNKRMIG